MSRTPVRITWSREMIITLRQPARPSISILREGMGSQLLQNLPTTKRCRLLDNIKDDEIRERVDNAILGDADPDIYLMDRVKRRDIFMSIVMIMVWEYIFTPYLFGTGQG